MEVSSTLTNFKTLCFPIDLYLFGFQAYRSMCLSPEIEWFHGLSQQTTTSRPPSFVNLSRFGSSKGSNFHHVKNRLKMQCCNEKNNDISTKFLNHKQMVSRFKPRWMLQHGNIRGTLVGLCFSVVVVTVMCHKLLAKIPYSKRADFVLSSSMIVDRLRGELNYKHIEWKYGGVMLPPTHPTSIKVEMVLREIIRALNLGLKFKQSESMTVSGQQIPGEADPRIPIIDTVESRYRKSEEMFKKLDLVYGKSHLERLDWKLTIVDSDEVAAFHILGTGRIVVGKNFIVHCCKTTTDIAVILGHEVGHSIPTDCYAWKLFYVLEASLRRSHANFCEKMAYRLLYYIYLRWFDRRMEVVADYVGMMVMAAAGYDPRAFPKWIKRSAKLFQETANPETVEEGRRGVELFAMKMRKIFDELFIETHPSSNTRVKALEQVLEEATAIYHHVKDRRGTPHMLLRLGQ